MMLELDEGGGRLHLQCCKKKWEGVIRMFLAEM